LPSMIPHLTPQESLNPRVERKRNWRPRILQSTLRGYGRRWQYLLVADCRGNEVDKFCAQIDGKNCLGDPPQASTPDPLPLCGSAIALGNSPRLLQPVRLSHADCSVSGNKVWAGWAPPASLICLTNLSR
jgi:hypothetical protein